MLEDRLISWDFVIKDASKEHHNDLDYIVDMMDWEVNPDPELRRNTISSQSPLGIHKKLKGKDMLRNGSFTEASTSKELTVFSKRSVVIRDAAPYGLIVVQGHGTINNLNVESPTTIRYREITDDELLVTIEATKDGVRIKMKVIERIG